MASQPFPFFIFILFLLAKSFLTLSLLLSSVLHFKPPQPEYYQVGVANSTKTKFKVETYLERVREKTSGGEMINTKMDSCELCFSLFSNAAFEGNLLERPLKYPDFHVLASRFSLTFLYLLPYWTKGGRSASTPHKREYR